MILSDEEIQDRIESPLNLLNRLKTGLHKAVHPSIPSLPPSANDIIPDLEDKLSRTTARTKANSIMIKAMTELENRVSDVQKPETLAKIATEMSKVIASQDAKPSGGNSVGQIIVYAPQVAKIEDFDIIDVKE